MIKIIKIGRGKRFFWIINGFLYVTAGCSGFPPDHIGSFAPCPNKPNCVSTQTTSRQHWIEPLRYDDSMKAAKARLLQIISKMPRTKLVINKENYMHVEFTSKIMRFVDDVEFYFNGPGLISFRSASRLGYSDMRVNRKRMEKIRKRFISKRDLKN